MSEVKHTPGPWRYRQAPDHAGYEIDAERWFSFARVERFEDFDHTDAEETREHDAECLGNACLIAAAPELLEALEWMIAYIDEHPDFIPDSQSSEAEWYDRTRNAIAKAKGGDA